MSFDDMEIEGSIAQGQVENDFDEQIKPSLTLEEEEQSLHQVIWRAKQNVKFWESEVKRWEKLQDEFYKNHPELSD